MIKSVSFYFLLNFRNELLYELKEKAATLGANAVVGLKIEANSVFEGCLDMVGSLGFNNPFQNLT